MMATEKVIIPLQMIIPLCSAELSPTSILEMIMLINTINNSYNKISKVFSLHITKDPLMANAINLNNSQVLTSIISIILPIMEVLMDLGLASWIHLGWWIWWSKEWVECLMMEVWTVRLIQLAKTSNKAHSFRIVANIIIMGKDIKTLWKILSDKLRKNFLDKVLMAGVVL